MFLPDSCLLRRPRFVAASGGDVVLVRKHEWLSCAVLRARKRPVSQTFGGYCERETPLPIPNREVKPLSADGTWPARAWESRSPPVLHQRVAFGAALFFVGRP